MLDARPDATPTLSWPGARLRRYAGRFTLEVTGEGVGASAGRGKAATVQWDWRRPLQLPRGRLSIRRDAQGDLDLDKLPKSVGVSTAAMRQAGGRKLRSLLQELEVPNWQRADLPLLYDRVPQGGSGQNAPGAGSDGRLLAVRDLWLAGSVRSDSRTRRRGRIVWS